MIYKRQEEGPEKINWRSPFSKRSLKHGWHRERKRSTTRSNNTQQLLPLFLQADIIMLRMDTV
jgi:hypothetical protein